MKISKRIVKAMAIEDMYKWVTNFKTDRRINNQDKEVQEAYWECIIKIQNKIIKEL